MADTRLGSQGSASNESIEFPSQVIVLGAGDSKQNLSAEVYAAYGGAGMPIVVPVLYGWDETFELRRFKADEGNAALKTTVAEVREAALGPEEIDAMLAGRGLSGDSSEDEDPTTEWKLIVAAGNTKQVFTRSTLQRACGGPAGKPVAIRTRELTVAEQAVVEDATARLSPKGGRDRLGEALRGPVANVALLAAAGGGFLALKASDAAPAITNAAVGVAVVLASFAVLLSLALTYWVKEASVNLSRLDLLMRVPSARSRQRLIWVANLATSLFALAVVVAAWALVLAPQNDPPPHARFSEPSTTVTAGQMTARFTASWSDLEFEAKGATFTAKQVGAPESAAKSANRSAKDHSVEHTFTLKTTPGSDIVVSTQRRSADQSPVGDLVTHTYRNVR